MSMISLLRDTSRPVQRTLIRRSWMWGPRPYSLQAILPRFTKNIFSSNIGPEMAAVEVSSNPLFAMSQQEIMDLNGIKYKELAQQQMRLEDSRMFCQNVISIIEKNIIDDTRLVASIMKHISNKEIQNVIYESLRRVFFDDDISLSLVELLSGNIEGFKPLFISNIDRLISLKQSQNTKRLVLKHYLQNLCYINTVVADPIVVPTQTYKDIYEIITKENETELYSYMFNLNIVPEARGLLRAMQNRLMRGSNLQQYVVRTGKLNCKWHDTVKSMNDDQIPKAHAFLAFEMVRIFAFQAVKRKDIVDSNLYLELLVKKFEERAQELEEGYFVVDVRANLQNQVQIILKLIIFYIMTFKGPKNCFKILDFIVKNELSINFDILITAMSNLRLQGYHDEAILLINNIALDKISNKDKQVLAEEILKLMTAKYPDSSKILVGYVAAMFKPLNLKYSVVDLLNDLKLLGIAYGSGTPGRISSTDSILSATIDFNLTQIPLTHSILSSVYLGHLQSAPNLTANAILVLFEAYMEVIKTSNFRFLNDSKINLDVINAMVEHLLNPNAKTPRTHTIQDKSAFDIAKRISTQFFKSLKLNPHNVKPALFETLIYHGLLYHNDHEFATQILKIAHLYKVPLTFNQIYPFITFHHSHKQYDLAENWYKLLIQNGVKAKSPAMKEIYKIAREQNWEVKGFVYRKNIIHQNYARKKAISDLGNDELPFAGKLNFHDSLSALLNSSK